MPRQPVFATAAAINGSTRKAARAELRAALRTKALGLPLSPHAEAVMLWIDRLRASQGDDAAKSVLAWAIGTSLTILHTTNA